MGTIYVLRNKINSKPYTGQTTQKFKYRLKGLLQSNMAIGFALRKYGIENFNKLLLENVPEEELDYWERHYIQECHSLAPNGYNLETGGHKNKHLSEEIKRKIGKANSQVQKGKQLSEEHKRKIGEAKLGEKNPQYGKHPSEETKIKLSESHKGKHHTDETRRKMSEAKKVLVGEKHPRFGKHHSEETKRKMTAARLEYWQRKRAAVF
jgi:group I intron endonuclease